MSDLPPHTPGISFLRRQAVNNINRLPMANISHVRENVRGMAIEELRWTAKATLDQIRWRARQDPDRLKDDFIPLNPWWYK